METYEVPGSLPKDKPVGDVKKGFFQNLINFFQERAAAKREKQEEKAFRDRVINFTKKENQEPQSRFIAGGPATIDLSKSAPGTIFRVETIRAHDAALVEEGEEEFSTNLNYYFWFVKGGRNQVYKIHGVVEGEETNNPSSKADLSPESKEFKFKLIKTDIEQTYFKPEDVLKAVYASEKNASNGFIRPEVSSDPNAYLHEIYKVTEVSIMDATSDGQIDGGGDKANVIDTVGISSNISVLQPSAS